MTMWWFWINPTCDANSKETLQQNEIQDNGNDSVISETLKRDV